MRLRDNEGLLVLEEVGTFQVPLVLDHLPELAKTCMVLYEARVSFRVLQTSLPDGSSDAHLVCSLHYRKTLSFYSVIRSPSVCVMLYLPWATWGLSSDDQRVSKKTTIAWKRMRGRVKDSSSK
jgi:hypothetical protein